MEITYWIIAGLVALLYLWSGGMKATQPMSKLQPMMAWAGTTIPAPGVRLIGFVEVLGAIGLILPPLTGVAPVLALVSAIGFVVLQAAAIGFHIRLGEGKKTGINLVLLILAAVLVWLSTTWL